MYLALPGMHSPHQASNRYIEKYRGKYDVGWDRIREERFRRQKKRGLIPEDASPAPRNPGIERWDDLNPDQRRVYARFQEVYTAMLEQTDYEIGRLLAELRRLLGAWTTR